METLKDKFEGEILKFSLADSLVEVKRKEKHNIKIKDLIKKLDTKINTEIKRLTEIDVFDEDDEGIEDDVLEIDDEDDVEDDVDIDDFIKDIEGQRETIGNTIRIEELQKEHDITDEEAKILLKDQDKKEEKKIKEDEKQKLAELKNKVGLVDEEDEEKASEEPKTKGDKPKKPTKKTKEEEEEKTEEDRKTRNKKLSNEIIKKHNIDITDLHIGGFKTMTKNGITIKILWEGSVLDETTNKPPTGDRLKTFRGTTLEEAKKDTKSLKQLKEEQKKLEKELDDTEILEIGDEDEVPGGPPIVSTITKKTKPKKIVKKKKSKKVAIKDLVLPSHTDAELVGNMSEDKSRKVFKHLGIKPPRNGWNKLGAPEQRAVAQTYMEDKQTGPSLFNTLRDELIFGGELCKDWLNNNVARIRLLPPTYKEELKQLCRQILGKGRLNG